MPIGDEFGKPHHFKLNAPRLEVTPTSGLGVTSVSPFTVAIDLMSLLAGG